MEENEPIFKDIKRTDLYKIFAERGYRVGAEIGVLVGGNASHICGSIPNLDKLYCVDCWLPTGGRGSKRNPLKYYRFMKRKLRTYIKKGIVVVVKKWSMDAVRDFEDERLDFVYIDADHTFDSIMLDIIQWSKKVRIGGIVSGHDYNVKDNYGVITAVRTYARVHKINPWYITRVESNGAVNWFWTKQ